MFDFAINDIDIADGSGAPVFHGSIAVQDGKIAEILYSGSFSKSQTKEIITGKTDELLTPGFIDTHTHGDLQHILDPYVRTQLFQGVTFDICGNCGVSAAPVSKSNFDVLKDYCRPILPFDELDEQWKTWFSFSDYLNAVKSVNPVFQSEALVGQGTLRIAVMGMENRDPSLSELEQMKSLLEDAMKTGAKGLSSGLVYIPGIFTTPPEMIELCKIVAKYDGFYSTHMRSESNNIVDAVKEAIHVAEESGCRLIISHLKVCGFKNEKFTDEILNLILDARARGVRVICDQYQSNKGSTTLAQLIPPQFQSSGTAELVKKLKNPQTKNEILQHLHSDTSYENYLHDLGPQLIIIVSNQKYPEFDGLTIAEIAEKLKLSPEETVCHLLVENDGDVLMALTMCNQSVVDKIFQFPYAAIGSDGIGAGCCRRRTHPRANGNYVHLFQDYVCARKLLSWEEAVRKCTSLPADFIGLKGKGHISNGYDADLVILNRKTVGTKATFAKPDVPPDGIERVFIKGKEIVTKGKINQ